MIARQNLFLSGAILVTLIPLSAFGVLGLAAVVAVHEVAEVFVILNGVRAGRRKAFRAHPPLESSRIAKPAAAVVPTPTRQLALVGAAKSDNAYSCDDC